MTKTLTPRVPAPPTDEPAQPPLMISPRVALAAAAFVALLAAVFAFAFRPAKLPATQQVAAAHYSVQMAGYAYAPAAITVNEGDTITWTNQDTAPHTVTTTSGPQRLNSPYLSKGQSWSYTFTAPGMYMYYCTVHPDMRAEVIVRAPAPATAAATTKRGTPSSPPAARAVAQPHTHTTAATTSTTAPSTPATSASAAAAPAAQASASTPSTTPVQAQAQTQAQQTADSTDIRTLSPVLLLGGLTAAIAVFCLLLVGSRPAPAPANPVSAAQNPSRGDNDDYEY